MIVLLLVYNKLRPSNPHDIMCKLWKADFWIIVFVSCASCSMLIKWFLQQHDVREKKRGELYLFASQKILVGVIAVSLAATRGLCGVRHRCNKTPYMRKTKMNS